MGLPISRQLVELMGGQIQVESPFYSKAGQTAQKEPGSRFWFEITLPVVDDSAIDAIIYRQQITGIKGDPPHLLLVDDNTYNQMVLTELLKPIGFKLSEAENGVQGLKQAINLKPDAALIDLMMPEMNGFELIRELRKIPELAELVIIATSASVFDEDRNKSIEVGANAFLPKPMQTNRLFDLLQQHLEIEWQYETSTDPAIPAIASTEPENYVFPSAETLQQLLDLAEIGDIAGLKVELEQISQTDTTLEPFVNKLEPMVAGFQINRICNILEKGLNGT